MLNAIFGGFGRQPVDPTPSRDSKFPVQSSFAALWPNGQVVTYVNFDAMNRVLLQTASNVNQGNTYNMATDYTYYTTSDGASAPVGLLKTFKDPHLHSVTPEDMYTYSYDLMGRKTRVTYPAEPVTGVHRTDAFSYDTAGRLYQYTTRASKTQTFTYDAINRINQFTWSDSTPGVTFTYDAASRVTEIDNANATISKSYFNDNLARTETETINGGYAKTVTYTYDGDANRASTQYPDANLFNYTYTGRNQLSGVTGWATYQYDLRGNLLTRTLAANGTSSAYLYDGYDRVTWLHHYLNGATPAFNYGYDSLSNSRTYARRLGSSFGDVGDAFSYDLADQSIAVQLNVATPQNLQQPITQNILYDPNGNRTWFVPPGSNKQYTTDNLSQYITINSDSLTYRADANLATYNGSTYNYDAQNRLTTATVGGVTMSFTYDGLNRQVSRTVGGTTTYSIWDGWNLIEDYQAANQGAITANYVYGSGGLIAARQLGQLNYYYQDASGNTSHVADGSGNLLEWYRYDLQGTPVFYNGSDQQISGSALGVRHLFTGQQWYSEIGLYDLRNRYYSPDIGRFLQPDPAGFGGDATNLYRYCGNNPLTRSDPSGLGGLPTKMDGGLGDALDIGNWVGDGTGSVGWGLTGIDVTNISGVLLDQAEFAYSMASYATQQYYGFAGFLYYAQTLGPSSLTSLINHGTPIPRAIPVNPQGTVTVRPIIALRGSNLTMAPVIYAGADTSMYTSNASDPSEPLTTQGWGVYYDTTTNTIGTYETHGNGSGFDVGAQILAGFVRGDINTFASPFTNVNGGLAYVHESWNADPLTMQIMGGSIGWGPTLPSLSTTYTTTTATPLLTPNTSLMFPYFGIPGH